MTTDFDVRNLHAELMKLQSFVTLSLEDLKILPSRGLTHDHVLLGERLWKGRKLVARIPRIAQGDATPEASLHLQAECFRRAGSSRHTPALARIIEPGPRLPNGALIVDAVEGRAVRLAKDLEQIAECLASVHRLPMPDETAPLARTVRPIAALVSLIEAQAEFVPALVTDRAALSILEEEREWARGFAAEFGETPIPPALVLTDTHPGNYIVGKDGKAVFVDMEKTRYGCPAIDLAHATLPTSVSWDPDVTGSLENDDVAAFYEAYAMAVPPSLARGLEPWFLPFRRLTWLRTTTWGCRWYAENEAAVAEGGQGQRNLMLRGVLERLRGMTRRETMERVRREWHGPDPLVLE